MKKYYADTSRLKVETLEEPIFYERRLIFDTYQEAKTYLISYITNKILGLQSTIHFLENKLDVVKLLDEGDL